MATEYKLSYTANEINTKLGKIDSLAEKSEIPITISDLENDMYYITEDDMWNYAQPLSGMGNYVQADTFQTEIQNIQNQISSSTSAVLYTSQSLDEAQKVQARENIGAVDTDGVIDILGHYYYATLQDLDASEEKLNTKISAANDNIQAVSQDLETAIRDVEARVDGVQELVDDLNNDMGDVLPRLDALETVFTGTDGAEVGSSGLVPAPDITDEGNYLSASGNWKTIDSSEIYDDVNSQWLTTTLASIKTEEQIQAMIDAVDLSGYYTSAQTDTAISDSVSTHLADAPHLSEEQIQAMIDEVVVEGVAEITSIPDSEIIALFST